jgi:hypothetical protein
MYSRSALLGLDISPHGVRVSGGVGVGQGLGVVPW